MRRLLNDCRASTIRKGRNEGQVVSARTVQMVHAVLRNAVEHAVREELVPRNVVKLVKVASPDYETGSGLSVADARRVLALVERDRLHAVYVLALMLGLRKGELLALRWEDVDLDGAQSHVRQTIQRVAGELQFSAPKTRKSRRDIPLPDPVVAALRSRRVKQGADRLAAGENWTDSGLIFTTKIGTPIEPRNLNRYRYVVRDRAELPDVRFHDLRHTFVTLLLDLGVRPHIVQAIAGHSGMEVTTGTYAHASEEEMRAALGGLGKKLG